MNVGGWASCAAVACVALLSVSPGTARAASADELIRQGVALRRSGDDAGALRKFEQAFHIDHGSKAMAQMGLAEQALGRWADASEHLQRALDDAGDPWIAKSRVILRQSLDHVNQHVGQLEILGGTAGAEVLIDGRSRGELPLPRFLAVSAGTITIELKAPSLVPVQRTIVVQARQSVRESFDPLVPVLPRSEPPPPTPAVAVAVPVSPTPVARPPEAPFVPAKTAPDREEDSSFRPKLKWVTWGAGAAALTVGIFGLVRQTQAANDFDGGCAVDSGNEVVVPPGSSESVSACRSLKDRVDSNYRIEVIGLVGAGVLAAAGLVLWLTEPAPVHEGAGASALACGPGLTAGHGPSLNCGLRF